MPTINWKTPKDPQEIRDYGINWTPDIGALSITTSVWTVVSGTVVRDSDTFNNTDTVDGAPAVTSTVRLSGGTDGEACQLLNHIVLSDGEEAEMTVQLKIKSR